MIQKTYHVANCTDEKLKSVLTEVSALTAYQNAAQVLLLLLDQNWDEDLISEKTDIIHELLPKAEIIGSTHVDQYLSVHKEKSCVLTVLMFEHPAFSVIKMNMSGKTDEAVRDELSDRYQGLKSSAKGMMVLFQKIEWIASGDENFACRDTHLILEKIKDIPVFGADAAISGYSKNSRLGYVFDGRGIYQDTLICVVFHGEDLHIRVSFNFGWTPVGKTMTINKLEDPYTITEIDGRPAAEVYEKYLGIPYQRNSLSIINICEFPFTVEEKGIRYGRIPYAWTRDGKLRFTAAFHAGQQIRLAYGLPQQIFSQVCTDTAQLRSFEAQAVLMVICLNRQIFLKEKEQKEINAYRSVVPDAAYLHGNSEIYQINGAGGEMHSALITIGFREGDPQVLDRAMNYERTQEGQDEVIPLEFRLMTFMRAVTKDLESTTDELLQLKDHLEDEVEIKTRENESLSLHVVQTLAEAIDAKDTYTNGHSGRVAKYSRAIAKRAGYSKKDQNEIFMMGLLHDVGKIGVPDAVINKPGKLTDEEFDQIKNHPVMGARILKTIKEMPRLVTGARWHHERYDGKGYPDGLKGDDIPEEARIIAVADAYDAMTSNRSYRSGMEQSKVREQIEKGKGTQFDPRFADIMLVMIDEDTEYKMRE